MKFALSQLNRKINEPITFSLILLVFAAVFIWLQNSAAEADFRCQQTISEIGELNQRNRYLALSVEFLRLSSQLAKLSLDNIEVTNLNVTRIEELRDNISLNDKKIDQDDQNVQKNNKAIIEAKLKMSETCESVREFWRYSSFVSLIMTLLAGSYGFWAGARNQKRTK